MAALTNLQMKKLNSLLLAAVNLLPLDYWGPVKEVASGGYTNFVAFSNSAAGCYSNHLGLINQTSSTNSWLRLRLTPDRDMPVRHGAKCAFKMAAVCGSQDTMGCYYWIDGQSTAWTTFAQITGPNVGSGLSAGQFPAITVWNYYSFIYTGTNDFYLLWEYDTGATARNYPNACGVDYFCWEPDLQITNTPIRLEMEAANDAPLSLPDIDHAQHHCLRISWPYFGPYVGTVLTNSYNLAYSFSLTNWLSIQRSNFNVTVFTDPTHTRAVTWLPNDGATRKFFQLQPNLP